MQELEKKVKSVRLRLRLFRVLDWALWGLLAGLTFLALSLLVFKLIPYEIDKVAYASVVLGSALLAGVIAAFVRRLTLFEAALQTDSRLQLRERLSSALILSQMHQTEGPTFHALEEDARHFAQAIRPGRDFRYQLPRHAKHTVWPALGILAIYFMPQFNLFEKPLPPPVKKSAVEPTLTAEERKQKAETLQELAKKARAKAEELDATKDDVKLAEKLERLSEDVALGKKNEKEMLAEMSRLNDDLKLEQREKNKELQPFKQIKGLQQANQTRDLQQDMKDQDFESAAEKLQKMAEALQNPEQMSSEDKRELAKELEQLAESLKENPKMAEALQQAAQAVQEAADQQPPQQQAQQNDQQSQQNQSAPEDKQASASTQKSQQQQQANQEGQSQSSKSQSAGQQKSQQAAQQASAAMQQAAKQVAAMKDLQQQMQMLSELQATMSQSMSQSMANSGQSQANAGQGQQGGQSMQGTQQGKNSQMMPCPTGKCPGGKCDGSCAGQGDWKEGFSERQGKGSGGPGRGRGQVPDSGADAQGFVDSFIPGQKNEGEIIAVFDVDAPAPKGESNVRYSNVPASYQQRAADSMTDAEIPVGMRNSVRDYFERINFGKEEAAPAAPATQPATPPATGAAQ